MPNTIDLTFAFFFAVLVTLAEIYVFVPKFRAALAAGDPDARRDVYRRAVYAQWAITLAAVALWARAGRPWALLGLVPPRDARLAVGIVIVALIVWLATRQSRAVRRMTAERRAQIKSKVTALEFMLPHDEREYRWFLALSTTAGICEELLYRGYLIWVLQAYIGIAGAVVATVLLFAFGHLYQGKRGALKAGGAALAMSLIVLATGWLIPAMVVHALIDISAGILGVEVLDSQRTPATTPAPVQ